MANPSLSTRQIRKIEGLIHGWTTKLTWDLLVGRIKTDLGITTTRQTLNTYTSIKTAYTDKKQMLRGKPTEALMRFTKKDLSLAEENQKLKAENKALNKRTERQQAFIAEIAQQARLNPTLMAMMERVKQQVMKHG